MLKMQKLWMTHRATGKKLTEQLRETEQVHSSLESEKASIVKLEKDAEAISFALKIFRRQKTPPFV